MQLFVGTNCMPCNTLKTWLHEKNIKVDQLIAEDYMSLAQELGIKSLPTLVLDDKTLIKGLDSIMSFFNKGN